MAQKNIFILLIILIVISNLYLIIKINYLEKEKNIEKFAVTDDIKTAISEIYKADIESIRALSNSASQLNAGSLNINAPLTVTNGLYAKGGAAGGNGNQTHFPWTDGINYIRGNTSHDGTLNVRDNVTVGNKLILPNNTQFSADPDWLRLTDTAGNYKPLAVKDLWADAGSISAGNIAAKDSIIAQGAIEASSIISNGDIIVKGNFMYTKPEITIGYNFGGSFAGSVSFPSNNVCKTYVNKEGIAWNNGIQVIMPGVYSVKFRVDFADNSTKGGDNGGRQNNGSIIISGFNRSRGHSCEGNSYTINPNTTGYNIQYKLNNATRMYPGWFEVDCDCVLTNRNARKFEIFFSNNLEANTSFAYKLKQY